MAPVNGVQHANQYEPPPSSMLATHVRQGHGVPHLNQNSFAQLLEESLGHDEDGNPNLNDDAEVNHKLILVVTQVGIDPVLVNNDGNPFDSSRPLGRKISQLRQCLAVLQLAISRSRQVLFKSVDLGESVDRGMPLFIYLLPRLFSLAGWIEDTEIRRVVIDIVSNTITTEQNHSSARNETLKTFLQTCLAGLLQAISKRKGTSLEDDITVEEDDFLGKQVGSGSTASLHSHFGFHHLGHALTTACQLSICLRHVELLRCEQVQVKKQSVRLQILIDDLRTNLQASPAIEHLNADIASLTVVPDHGDLANGHVDHDEWPDSDRARKRARLSIGNGTEHSETPSINHYTMQTTEQSLGRSVMGTATLTTGISTKFKNMDEEAQCTILENIGLSACRSLSQWSNQTAVCTVCDEGVATVSQASNSLDLDGLMQTLLDLRLTVQRNLRLRFPALIALRRLALHMTSSVHLQLKGSIAGEWCLQSLRASSREVRLIAARTMQAFVRSGISNDTNFIHENRIVALEYLQAMWLENNPSSQEIVIIALTQMAEVVEDEELNIILLRLIDYLGHRNAYLAGLVYSELQQLQERLHINMAGLFRPFWRTLSIAVVKNFATRPEIAHRLSDLIGVQLDGLWQIIEGHALPYLVLNRDRNLIERISASSSSPITNFDLCMKEHIAPRIMAVLLAQSFPNPEQSIMALLLHVSQDFREEDLTGWINYQSVGIACELLKMIGDAGQGKSTKAYQGLQYMTQLIPKKPGHGQTSRKTDHTAAFLETNALAITTLCTVKINEGAVSESNVEKRRCLAALGEFTRIGKSKIKVALPQISACFRVALEDQNLCNIAFFAWATMMMSLAEDEIVNLISQTFAIVVRAWDSLNTKMQESAHNLIGHLIKQHNELIHKIYSDLPSLSSIPIMSEFENEISGLKHGEDERDQITAFVDRIEDENSAVVEQALHELVPILRQKQDLIQRSVLREQSEPFIKDLTRAILDACVRFDSNTNLLSLAGQCLGAIGCLDPSKSDSAREKKTFVLTKNFRHGDESLAFVMFFMEEILIKEYVSTPNLREKGFLAWSLQQLLAVCDLPPDVNTRARTGGAGSRDKYWFGLSDSTRLILTPFLTSKFVSLGKRQKANITYPFFKSGMTYKHWLTEVTLDFLNRGSGVNVDMIFDVCCRLVVSGQGTSISSFLLPYAALNLLLSGIEQDKLDLMTEISWVLEQSMSGLDIEKQDHIRQCSQSVFDILDYMSIWLQETRKHAALSRGRLERGIKDLSLEQDLERIDLVAATLASVSPNIITQRAIECRSYARALFHQEQYIRSRKEPSDADYQRLQDIYAQIDEPDGIEGISAQIKFLDVESEVMEHKKAGRWNTAQSWYEMQLMEKPDDTEVQLNLMKCLKESGQHDVLIHHFDGMGGRSKSPDSALLPFVVEAAWVTSRWDKLSTYLSCAPKGDFAVSIGTVMLAIKEQNQALASEKIESMFQIVTSELTPNSTGSFQACHETWLKMHVLDDIRIMIEAEPRDGHAVQETLNKRLNILGSYVADKQYLLGIQRAIMDLKSTVFNNHAIATSWLISARLARKAQATNQAFHAVLRASMLGDKTTAIEQAKLMWQEGHHRKAIHTLEGAIESGAFTGHTYQVDGESTTVDAGAEKRNDMTAKAYVLLGKWLDQAGQTQSDTIIKTFRKSTEQHRRWEKGWYNLGRHYNKILESEKLKSPGKESQTFLTGETAKLVIDNFLRVLISGNKYWFQTLPKVLTLWLELVAGSNLEHDSRRGNTQFHAHNAAQRKKVIEETNANMKKYVDRIPTYALYAILPQLVARICHPDQMVNSILQLMIIKMIKAFPQQSLWTVLATVKSSNKDRATRGLGLMRKAVENTAKKDLKVFNLHEMRDFFTASQRFADELLRIADFEIQNRMAKISLAKDFNFNHKITPSKLVVPCQACLIPNIPTNNESISGKTFRAFANEPITISAFLDEARVLPSLQKPRKLSLRGSDGQIYSVLAKPHDDLRKDQRLLEFDTMINRFLKRDINASKRRLYIRTYAVVPLNEECGLIEWVDGLKTMRDIILESYRQRGIQADYGAVREQLDIICAKSENKAKDYRDRVQSKFPPVLRQWFTETFPDPSTWFNARLRYTRSSAVMSMVGHVLGLGDRHGENILFEEGNGGVLHVDFNCLFDKGLTFEKPEMVPFRLTHNMVDAFGPYRVDGPFRRCCEITLSLLRSNEDALMTILETFLHDPTTDFMTAGKKRKTNALYVTGEVPDTPERMLEGVKAKVRGMLAGESVPLSVGGYVEEMINRAKDEANLARMYIGWCAFL